MYDQREDWTKATKNSLFGANQNAVACSLHLVHGYLPPRSAELVEDLLAHGQRIRYVVIKMNDLHRLTDLL